jgi:hypothetical protein
MNGWPKNESVFFHTGFWIAFKSSITSEPWGGAVRNAFTCSSPHGRRGTADRNHACSTHTVFGSALAIEEKMALLTFRRKSVVELAGGGISL